jgi:hypothetical protein
MPHREAFLGSFVFTLYNLLLWPYSNPYLICSTFFITEFVSESLNNPYLMEFLIVYWEIPLARFCLNDSLILLYLWQCIIYGKKLFEITLWNINLPLWRFVLGWVTVLSASGWIANNNAKKYEKSLERTGAPHLCFYFIIIPFFLLMAWEAVFPTPSGVHVTSGLSIPVHCPPPSCNAAYVNC